MSWSLKLFTVRGIAIRVHVSFLLIVLWAAYLGISTGGGDWAHGAAFMLIFMLLLFACVVLHELGHSLVAQLFGVQVQDITLWPIGGVARMTKMPEKPYQEFLISAAGPATNVLLAIGLGTLALVVIGPRPILNMILSPWRLEYFMSQMNIQALILLLTANNVLLALFNLLPAFPMDGGRLLRSFLAIFLPFPRATSVASIVGQVMAALMGLAALLTNNIFLILVSVFVFMAAWQERQQTVFHDNLRGLRVNQAMQPIGLRLHPLQTLGDVLSQTLASPQTAYLVIDNGRLVGTLSRGELLVAVRKSSPEARVAQHMRRDILRLRPDDLLLKAQSDLAQGKFSVGVIVQDGRVIGILDLTDLMRVAEMLKTYPQALLRE